LHVIFIIHFISQTQQHFLLCIKLLYQSANSFVKSALQHNTTTIFSKFFDHKSGLVIMYLQHKHEINNDCLSQCWR